MEKKEPSFLSFFYYEKSLFSLSFDLITMQIDMDETKTTLVFHLIKTISLNLDCSNYTGSGTERSGLSKPERWVPPPLVSMAMDLN